MTEPTITYSWKIEQLDATPMEGDLANVVRKVHWRLFGSDGINTMDLYGDVLLSAADPTDFVAYTNLAEATVIDWLEAAIDARAGDDQPDVAQLQANLAAMLAAKRSPSVVAMPVPW
jgi:hypothetical protein